MATKRTTKAEPETQPEQVTETESATETNQETEPETQPEQVTETEQIGKYPTDFYRSNNIPYCDVCGEKYRNRLDGSPVCPEKRKDCPRIA